MSTAFGSNVRHEEAVPLAGHGPRDEQISVAWISGETVPLRQTPERTELEEQAERLSLIVGNRGRWH